MSTAILTQSSSQQRFLGISWSILALVSLFFTSPLSAEGSPHSIYEYTGSPFPPYGSSLWRCLPMAHRYTCHTKGWEAEGDRNTSKNEWASSSLGLYDILHISMCLPMFLNNSHKISWGRCYSKQIKEIKYILQPKTSIQLAHWSPEESSAVHFNCNNSQRDKEK